MGRTVVRSTIYQIRARVDPSRMLNIGATTRQKIDYELRIGFSKEYLDWMYNPPDREGGYTVGDVINFLDDKGVDILYPIERRRSAITHFVQRGILETVNWKRVSSSGKSFRETYKKFEGYDTTKTLMFERRPKNSGSIVIGGKRYERVGDMEIDPNDTYEIATIAASSIRNILDRLGRDMVRDIKDEILGSIAPALKESTIERRMYKHKKYPGYYKYLHGIEQGLSETGHLIDSITYEVIDRSSTAKELTYENIGGKKFRHVAGKTHIGRPKGSGDTVTRFNAKRLKDKLESYQLTRGSYKGVINWADRRKMSIVDFMLKYPGVKIVKIKLKKKATVCSTLKTRKMTQEERRQRAEELIKQELILTQQRIMEENERLEPVKKAAFKNILEREWETKYKDKKNENDTRFRIRGFVKGLKEYRAAIKDPSLPLYVRHAYQDYFTEFGYSI